MPAVAAVRSGGRLSTTPPPRLRSAIDSARSIWHSRPPGLPYGPAMDLLAILSRYVHVVSAILVVGGAFFLRVLLPAALRGSELSDEAQRTVVLRCRKAFKHLVHTVILLLILSGSFNAWRLFPQYGLNPALLHGLWGAHVILALVAFAITFYLLAGPRPPSNARPLALGNLVLLLAIVLVASSLKGAREKHLVVPRAGSPPAATAPAATAPSP